MSRLFSVPQVAQLLHAAPWLRHDDVSSARADAADQQSGK